MQKAGDHKSANVNPADIVTRENASDISRPWLAKYPACVPQSPVMPEVAAWQPLLTTAEQFPDRVACRYMSQEMTYAELADASRRCAAALVRLGVKPGDRVGILLPNIPEYPVALNGIWMAGAVAVSISPLSVTNEVSGLLKATDCRTVISLDMLAPLVLDGDVKPEQVLLASIRKHMSFIKRLGYCVARLKKIGLISSGPKRFWFDQELARSSSTQQPLMPGSIDDPAYILATGGTTGHPKAVTLSHRNLVANSQQIWHWAGGRRGVDSMLAVIPFFHSYGLTSCLMTGITLGATLVMYHRFNPKVAIELLIKERVSIFPSVPLMLEQMNTILREGKHKVLGLRYVISGGAALDLTIAEEFHGHTGAQVVEGYGLSEAGPVTHTGPLDGTNIPGTIGLPLPNTEAKIVDVKTGSHVMPPGEVGELLVRGPQVMLGYWNNPAATAEVIDSEGWLSTGDLATSDESGFFRIVDRKKDLIITSGYNVYPTDIEHTLRLMPGVVDVAVVGVPERARGELVKAIVAVDSINSFDRDAFDALIADELAHHKRPQLFEFTEGDLPRNFLGKVLRRKLRDEEDVTAAPERSKIKDDGSPTVKLSLKNVPTGQTTSSLRRSIGRGRYWMVMAAVLVVFGFYFDDLAQMLLTDSHATAPQPLMTQPREVAVARPEIKDVHPGLLDTEFARAVTDGDELTMADSTDPATVVEPKAPDVNDVLTAIHNAGNLLGRDALSATLALLQTGHDRLALQNSYSAMFERRERVGGELRDDERIRIKVRHSPFNVYMKWLTGDPDREILYGTGQRDGCMLIRLGGLRGRILPSLKLDPYGSRAMGSSRYPITECGLLHLCKTLIDFRRGDLAEHKHIDCEIRSNAMCDDRESIYLRLEYLDRNQSLIYRKTQLHIDRESLLPVCIWNYTWPKDPVTGSDDADTLIEHYHYTNLVFDQKFADADFDSTNPAYRFRR